MNPRQICITGSGVIILGPDITCDGFHRDFPVRVQTHIHSDHMQHFETSKGLQHIYCSHPTRQLLVVEFNAEMPARRNVIGLDFGVEEKIRTSHLKLVPAEHILGSVQVGVQLKCGNRVGYSGDFQWPMANVIKVDELVLDSTYGSPSCVRKYSQSEAEEELLRIATDSLAYGPLYIKSHRGTLQRGLQVLSEIQRCPMVVSPRLAAEIDVYRKCGYPIGPVVSSKSPDGIAILKDSRFMRFYGKGDKFPVQITNGTTITLSAFMAPRDNPVLEYSDRAFRVALTDHADFEGTLAYIKETGAKYVLTDNSRGGHAHELAQAITHRLGIEAEPSGHPTSREWGV